MLHARVSRSRVTPVATEKAPRASTSRTEKKKTPPRSRALSAETLEQLGAVRLAEILMAQTKGDPALARLLRLALAGTDGDRLASEVEKRLRTIQRSKGFIEWDKVKPLARELDSLRETIASSLAAANPRAAVAQMRLLLDLGEGVLERSDDGSGRLGEVFRQAGAELGRLWGLLPVRDPVALATDVLALLDADGYGLTDRLLTAASVALGPEGRAALRRLLQARLAAQPRSRNHDDYASWRGSGLVSFWLRELADLDGDVDAFIAAAEAGGRVETLASDIAERLIAYDRPADALAWLDRAPARHEGDEVQQVDLRIAVLDLLGRKEEAQALRWEGFSQWLSAAHLRPYLRGLPDFEDVEAEDRAMAHALSHPDRHRGLTFLTEWPNLLMANRLVREHHRDFDGRDYTRLRPAAEVLAEKHPAAATLLHRALAEDVLKRAASPQYQYAVHDVRSCANLASLLPAEADLESHAAFMERIRREHPRKTGFWSLLNAPTTR